MIAIRTLLDFAGLVPGEMEIVVRDWYGLERRVTVPAGRVLYDDAGAMVDVCFVGREEAPDERVRVELPDFARTRIVVAKEKVVSI